ncbi:MULTISPECIES: hypothetical protein [unclassified Azospirillum]|jgi:hypothetical protein|uniref:hypothetical protein n=1 Tax=unclassified Azospirillum TaxID=2630922 RepID=UPI000B6E6703|nr:MULTISPECIES: hypothetical protein [unclassified Azospirillum]SNS25469.1 hypothetical protein SAMN05880556_103182 [Azospirillum sp. RU38E]SNS43936.1 hypothetical protein SAMN05880591_103182 [Azospirillum sp. RU37A]
MRGQVGNYQGSSSRNRWLALCCAGWLCANPVWALADAQPQGGLAQFRLKTERSKPMIQAGKVKEKKAAAAPSRHKTLPQTLQAPALALTPAEPELLPQRQTGNPFRPPPKNPGDVSSRVHVVGKGLTVGIQMPF